MDVRVSVYSFPYYGPFTIITNNYYILQKNKKIRNQCKYVFIGSDMHHTIWNPNKKVWKTLLLMCSADVHTYRKVQYTNHLYTNKKPLHYTQLYSHKAHFCRRRTELCVWCGAWDKRYKRMGI